MEDHTRLMLEDDGEPRDLAPLHHLCAIAASAAPAFVPQPVENDDAGQLAVRTTACASLSEDTNMLIS
jgi:hypothetical protein